MISERIRHLIDTEDQGNVSAAARRLGCPQRTLAKVYSGETRNPGADLLQAIVERYPVDPAWLLTGVESREWTEREERIRQQAVKLLMRMLESLEE